ncbi:SDR family NAD(P)-dependent oxidoreductase [Caldimonas sp.]|uniref:SDR family NAD(P)-dependent oxidoreductase n=1 Tax=Caldimonas sp. TaxID=2838790 RepID=UPI00391A07D5
MNDTSSAGFDTDIAVVGMAGRFAGARNLDEYWRNLRDGVESLTRFTEEELLAAGVKPAQLRNPNYVPVGAVLPDMEMFDAAFFGFSPREAAIMDPQHRHFLECSWEALENAGHTPSQFKGSIGVFGGSGHNAYMPYNLLTNPQLVSSVGFFLIRHTGNDKDFLTTRVSYLLNLKGPSVNVQTACSTSLVAIHLGVQSLLNGECDMALAGGVTIELPHRQGYVYQEGEILSPDGHCRAFDADSKGTVFGSGVGVVVLRRLADAIADGDHIHAVIKGSAVNNDGSMKVGYMAPSVDGQAQAIAEALAIANVPPDTITYVEAHGTGTPVGDPIEIAALTQAYREGTDKTGYCGIGSVKTNIGHTDTAAGVASFMKVALAMQHGQLPPSLHFAKPNPACEFERSPFYVNATLKDWTPPPGVPRRAGVSSLGVGGTNAHVILEEAPPRQPSGPSREHQLLMLSAKSQASLDANTAALAAHLREHPQINLADVAYTLQVGREPMKLRRIVVARDAADAAQALEAMDPQRVISLPGAMGSHSLAFMFAGGGAQYPGMGADLYRSEPVYRQAVDECLALLAKRSGIDYKGLLFPPVGQEEDAARRLERPSLALPLLLTTQYALARLWMSWGLTPSAMIGHSMGEYTAAHLAGVFSLEDALTLVELRGRLFETLPEGGMLSVPLPEAEVQARIGPELSIAAVNGPSLTVVAGPVQAIEALQQALQAEEIEAARVRINVAAHSSMLEPILEEFGAFFRRVAMKPPTLPFVSNLSGTWITPAEATDPQYWVRHLRHTVRFADGLQELLNDESRILLEVGPGRTLSSLARQHSARKPQQVVLNSLRHPDEKVDDQAYVLGILGRLWAAGAPIDWARFRQGERRLRLPLPTYRFDHQRHWIEPGLSLQAAPTLEERLARHEDMADWFYEPVWKRSARPQPEPLAGPVLVFEDEAGLGEELARQLREAGQVVTRVRPGKAYAQRGDGSFTITPDAAGDYDRLFAALRASGALPSRIFHLWSVTGDRRLDSSLKTVDELQRLGFYSLLQLAQAIGREDLGEPMRLAVVTDRLQRVGAETGLMPAKATAAAVCRVISQEFRHIRCCAVDVQVPPRGSRQAVRLAADVAAELAAPPSDEVVALRLGERWLQDFAPVRLERPAPGRAGLRERGVYLITGGLGGVGLALAEHLALSVKARLVLVGRSGLPPREGWAEWVREKGPREATSRRIRQVMALESRGAEVMVAQADVTDLVQMRQVVKQAVARFGALHGVLHTAGVLDDGVIQLKEPGAAAAVLAPKVQGTLTLDAALGDLPLDFLVLFSSISSFAGLAGQFDYAAANAFLDAFAQERTARDGRYTVAINWSQWQEVGMAAELARRLGIGASEAAQGEGVPVDHPLLDRCLLDTDDERVYSTRFAVERHWLLDEHRIRGGQALIPGTGYLEIVRAAAMQHREARTLELRDVTFLSPFIVREGEERELQVRLRALPGGQHDFALRSPAGGGDEAGWNDHVRGEVGYVDAKPPVAQAPAAIAARCTVRAQHFRGDEQAVHLQFGPRWSNLRRIDFGQGEALAMLELPEAFTGDLLQFELHPALMDLATAGAQSLIPGFDEARDFFVPASYGCLRVFAPLTAKVYSHIRLRPPTQAVAQFAVYDVTIMDESGRVLVDIREFTMVRVRDKALLDALPASGAAAGQRPRATANKVLEMGLSEGLRSAEGAEVLERVLADGRLAQVAVSPQDLHATLEKLRTPVSPAPAASEQADESRADWKAPRTETEQLIAQMWGEMLGVAKVSASDNFFDLGGHSLLAVQVINKLKRKTGKQLPLTALLEAPTVEALAALIEPPPPDAAAGETNPGDSAAPAARVPGDAVPALPRTVVRIRAGGDRPPIFFVHDGKGETLLYRTLALKLDAGHAIYGLQPEMRHDGSYVHTRIVDMAAAHVRAVRSVQPEGPYLLTGLCAGGVIAFEMARQLEDAGQRVIFVGIMDAADVHAQERPFRVAQNRIHRFLGTLNDPSAGSTLQRIGRAVPKMLAKTRNLALYEVQSRLERFHNARKVRAMRDQAERGEVVSPVAEEDHGLDFLKMYEVAHREHQPQGVFRGGDVVVFRGLQGDGSQADEPYKNIYSDPQLGWGPRVESALSVIDVPGGHTSMLQEPHVGVLAGQLQRCIDRAISRHGVQRDRGQPEDDSRAADAPVVARRGEPQPAEVE